MSRLRTIPMTFFLLAALAGGGLAESVYTARYKEIREMIHENLHFTAHLTWAVTLDTIADLRGRITEADIPVLIQMLGDEDGRARIAAGGLLTILGDAAVPALQAARQSTDYRVSTGASDALIRLEECRNDPKGMNPAACP